LLDEFGSAVVDQPSASLDGHKVGNKFIDVEPASLFRESSLKKAVEKALCDYTLGIGFANCAEEFVRDSAAVGIDLMFVDDLDECRAVFDDRRIPILWK
jgi:hypothetical protein